MNTIQITDEILNQKIENKPSRFDMAINFYCCVKKDDKYYLVAYYYNPTWNLFYPFYDDINKTPIKKESAANTYKDLLQESDSVLNVNLNEKLDLAHKRFKELIGCDCEIKECKHNKMYELKYSKTANLYTIYTLYNYIITKVENLDNIFNPKMLKAQLFDLDNLDGQIVENAIWFCDLSKDELKNYAIKI